MGQSEPPSEPAHTAESGQLSFPGTLPGLTVTLDATAGLIRFEWTDAAGNVVRRARLEPTGTRAPFHVLRWVCEPAGLHPGDYCLAALASTRALLKRIFRRCRAVNGTRIWPTTSVLPGWSSRPRLSTGPRRIRRNGARCCNAPSKRI